MGENSSPLLMLSLVPLLLLLLELSANSAMEDVLTEIPPPSRFFQEDLNNFTPPSPPLPSPFLAFSFHSPHHPPLRPSLLVVAISSPSLHAFHTAAPKTLIGTLVLPETAFAGNSIAPSPSLKDKSIHIHSLPNDAILVSFQCPVAAERCHAVAKLLISEQIAPDRVVVLDSVQTRNFRGKLTRDEEVAFKLETTSERKSGSSLLKGLGFEYLPSASVVDGLGAALLAQCEAKKIKAVLCVTWPEFGYGGLGLIKAQILPALGLDLGFESGAEDCAFLGRDKDPFDSDLYS